MLGDVEGYLRWGRGRVLESMNPAGVHTCWGVWECVLGMLEVCAWGAGLASGSGEGRPLGWGLVLGFVQGWADCSVSGLGTWVGCL